MKRLRALSAALYPVACLPNFRSNKMRSHHVKITLIPFKALSSTYVKLTVCDRLFFRIQRGKKTRPSS
ncbi:hypothetical protein [Nostoc sp.]|uniref:hypothetical protein n=1 Tax=Nostoc sp. TaxID=1180 RepID=UPI002FFA76C1